MSLDLNSSSTTLTMCLKKVTLLCASVSSPVTWSSTHLTGFLQRLSTCNSPMMASVVNSKTSWAYQWLTTEQSLYLILWLDESQEADFSIHNLGWGDGSVAAFPCVRARYCLCRGTAENPHGHCDHLKLNRTPYLSVRGTAHQPRVNFS